MEKWIKPVKTCNTCTKHLVDLCYERSLMFRLFRASLVITMKLLALSHGIKFNDYLVKTRRCQNCIRFMKNALKEKSPAFAKLNDWINPYFNRYRDSLISADEKAHAKSLAAEFMEFESD
jgi:hypothetical protein